MSIFAEFFRFMIRRKKFWLMPVVLIMAGLGALIAFSQGSVITPFIYAIF